MLYLYCEISFLVIKSDEDLDGYPERWPVVDAQEYICSY